MGDGMKEKLEKLVGTSSEDAAAKLVEIEGVVKSEVQRRLGGAVGTLLSDDAMVELREENARLLAENVTLRAQLEKQPIKSQA
jgi:hypothetical protein